MLWWGDPADGGEPRCGGVLWWGDPGDLKGPKGQMGQNGSFPFKNCLFLQHNSGTNLTISCRSGGETPLVETLLWWGAVQRPRCGGETPLWWGDSQVLNLVPGL